MTQHLTNNELIDFLHDALPAPADAAAYAHLEQCASCRTEYDAEASLTDQLRSYAAREERELPPMLKAAIWERIRSAQPSALSRLAALWRPALGVPLAAAIALAAYFGTMTFGAHPPGTPAIDAAYYLQDHAALNGTMPFSDRNAANPVDLESQASSANGQQTLALAASSMADAIP